MMGAGIPYPYQVPNKTLPDGTPGIWTLIGVADIVQEQIEDETSSEEGKSKVEISCGERREDEK